MLLGRFGWQGPRLLTPDCAARGGGVNSPIGQSSPLLEVPALQVNLNPETEVFRLEVRRFIHDNLPDDTRLKVAREQMDLPREDQQRWFEILHRRGGWTCPSWPAEHGGPGWSAEQQYVFERELALNDAPRLHVYGAGMLGPTVIEFGSEAQKARFLPGILSGTTFWCQGFSEPNAGSDLASLQCRAARDGDVYVVNGSKIWTSEAHIADWLFGLFRTATKERKQQGITFLTVDLESPGITIRPIITFEGAHEVNQVFFDDVRVPADQRVGEEDEGWRIAKHLLGLERFGTAEVSRSLASLARLEPMLREIPAAGDTLAEDPAFSDRVAELGIDLRALELTERRFLFGPGGPDALGPEASMLKIRGTEIQQRILELTMEAMSYHAHAMPQTEEPGRNEPALAPKFTPPGAGWSARNYFNYRKTSIYSGSNEIQKNIIAKAVMGL